VASDAQRREKTFWEVAAEKGFRTAVVNWWATWPAESVRGFMVTDRIAYQLFHDVVAETAAVEPDSGRGKTWPPELYGDLYHKVRINYYPPKGDDKEGWDNIDIFGWLGYPMQIKIDFLCKDSILAAPIVLDLALLMDLAARSGRTGVQEWLSFYFKSPQAAAGLYAENDLFIQLTKLKNNLRHMMGEELITHLGTEYYDEA